MLITGDAREFGRFDVPTLFGVARTAPYFHDNSAATLDEVVRHYQALFELLTFFANNNLFAPPVNGQGCNAGECAIRPLPDDEVAGLARFPSEAVARFMRRVFRPACQQRTSLRDQTYELI